jgi:hypothetical protein
LNDADEIFGHDCYCTKWVGTMVTCLTCILEVRASSLGCRLSAVT